MKLETNESVYEHMGKMCEGWGEDLMGKHGYSAVGAVVGATYPEQLGEMSKTSAHILPCSRLRCSGRRCR
jgi:orotidine-5'-phosphate decarboxylase